MQRFENLITKNVETQEHVPDVLYFLTPAPHYDEKSKIHFLTVKSTVTLPACTLPSLPSFFVLSPLNGVSAPCNKFKSKTVCQLSSPATPVRMHILCFVSAGYLQTNILRRCDALPGLSHHFQHWTDFHRHRRLSHSVCE